uniref:DUF2281 domain-containing protein n=1 Tax=Chlorobium chlorochromatii (strain CaD3) TaxID=340177 RepID=Q3ASE0_CHLCH
MTAIDIKKTLAIEVEKLSVDALQEVLDFVQFLKIKQWRNREQVSFSQQRIADDLHAFDINSVVHLEEEFADYKKEFPYE